MRKMIAPLTAFSVLAVALIASASVKPGDEAPAFSLQDQNGKTANLSDYKGKIVVLEWFNDGCPFVQRHYKAKTMNDKYKDKDVVWLAINSTAGKKPADNKSAAESMNVDHPILADTDSSVAKAYGAKSTPDMFVIDKDGKIAYEGAIDNDPDGTKADKVNYVDKALSEILAGKSVSEPQTESYGCHVHYQK